MKICRENGIRALKDGKLEIIFTSAPKSTLTMGEMALRDRVVADSER